MTKTMTIALALLALARPSLADDPRPKPDPSASMAVEADVAAIGPVPGVMAGLIARYDADRGSITRSAPPRGSAARDALLRRFDESWLKALDSVDFDPMDVEDRVDYVLFRSHLKHGLRQLDLDAKQRAEVAPLVPFAPIILDLDASRRRMERPDGERVPGCSSLDEAGRGGPTQAQGRRLPRASPPGRACGTGPDRQGGRGGAKGGERAEAE